METAKTWNCDTCGEEIKKAEEGYLEWLDYRDSSNVKPPRAEGLQITHNKKRCLYDSMEMYKKHGCTTAGNHLHYYTGHDGLIRLLQLLHEGLIPKGELLGVIRRIFIPGYDTAFRHFEAAISNDIFEPNTPDDFYRKRDIDAVVAWVKKGQPAE